MYTSGEFNMIQFAKVNIAKFLNTNVVNKHDVSLNFRMFNNGLKNERWEGMRETV